MKKIWRSVLKGLGALLPTGIVVYLVYWLGSSAERLLRPLIEYFVTETYYIPGMALVTGVLGLIVLGLIVNAWIVRKVLALWEKMIQKVPVVKTLFNAVKDFADFFTDESRTNELKKVVEVAVGEARILGFVTAEDVDFGSGDSDGQERIAVYIPMSYQIGGFTFLIPRDRVTPVDMSVEEGMRLAFTACLSRNGNSKTEI